MEQVCIDFEPPYTVLVVDDQVVNSNVVSRVLRGQRELRVITAQSGEEALEIAKEQPLFLILMDIMMPGMGGYEAVRQLKQMPQLQDIPVIFLSGQEESESLVEGFRCGGVDYITKPFVPEVLVARVEAHVNLYLNHLSRDALRRRERAAEAKERDIAYHNGVTEMGSEIIHNIGNLLGEVYASVLPIDDMDQKLKEIAGFLNKLGELLKEGKEPEKVAAHLNQIERILTSQYVPKIRDSLDGLHLVYTQIKEVVLSKRQLTQGGLVSTYFPVQPLVADVVAAVQEQLDERGIRVEVAVDAQLPEAYLPRNPLRQMVLNLMDNSLFSVTKALEDGVIEAGAGRITVSSYEESCEIEGRKWGIEVADNGVGLDPAYLQQVIELGVSINWERAGLGLHNVANFVIESGGMIELNSPGEGQGFSARMLFPVTVAEADG